MSTQKQTRKRKSRTEPAPEQETETHDTAATDELLSDIDNVLEEMGVEFAVQYTQKGGQ